MERRVFFTAEREISSVSVMSSSGRPPKAASNKRCSLGENRTEAAGRRKTNQSRCQIGPSRVLASGQQSEARQEFPAMAYLPNRHSVDELLQQKPPVLPDKRSEHCCSCIHGLQIGSLRAQAWESGRQHRDVPIRMVRSTYVV